MFVDHYKTGAIPEIVAETRARPANPHGRDSYDPAFDIPERLRGYAENRGVLMNAGHRMLRAVDGINALRVHFELGVNFIASLVNRHRIEVYLLDAAGGIAASF